MSRSSLLSLVFTLLLTGLLALILQQNLVPVSARAQSGWDTLLQTFPQPHLHPLPEPEIGPFDGTYAKLVSAPPMWWKCFRCADYRVSGGIWKLQFEQGVMRLYYDATGWHSLASYIVSGDQVTLFNDPWCPDVEGHYTWQLTDAGLALTPVEDGCSFELRAENLSEQPWQTCTSDTAPGCQETVALPDPVSPSARTVEVTSYSGDSRFYATPPDVTALANLPPAQTPEGVTITLHPASVSFGVSRVLWWEGNWIEVTTARPFTAMGVQFLGELQIGWARVLFDGEEIWNGNTTELGYENYRHGGYVEISGFVPGPHTLRVESLGFDYRPVTVVSFGFNEQGGVQP